MRATAYLTLSFPRTGDVVVQLVVLLVVGRRQIVRRSRRVKCYHRAACFHSLE